jgi:hypothetical protein
MSGASQILAVSYADATHVVVVPDENPAIAGNRSNPDVVGAVQR